MFTRHVWLMLLLFLAGCGDPLTKLVNEKFPPISAEAQRQAAINSSATTLARMPSPNVGASITMSDAAVVLYTDELKKQGVTKLSLDGEKQLLRVKIDFARQFTGKDAGDDRTVVAVLDKLKPRIQGNFVFYAGISGAIASQGEKGSELELRLLPAISSIEIDKIEIADKFDATAAGDALASLINRYKDNISGEISRSPVTRVTMPALSTKLFDPSKTISVTDGAGNATIELISQPIRSPLQVAGIAWLVDDKQLTTLVELSPTDFQGPIQLIPVDPTFDGIKKRVEEIVEQVFQVPDLDKTWVAVKKEILASTVNDVMSQAQLCVKVKVSVPEQRTSQKISLPNGLGINCSSDRVCSSDRQCSFNANHDTRDCSACLIRTPRACAFGGCVGGQCTLRGNDPFCEAAKVAQNAIYVTDANLRKADCDRLRETENATCEVEKAGEKLLCETKKEALNRLAATGNFANLDIASRFESDNLQICLRDFNLSLPLDRVQFALEVQGGAKADVNVKFVPLDIVGHLTCKFPWSQSKTFSASLRESRVGIGSNIQLTTDTEGTRANFAIDNVEVKARLRPSPTEFLLTSPEMLLKCPVIAGLAPTVIALTPFIPPLRGDIDYTLKDIKASVSLAIPQQIIGDKPMSVTVANTAASIVATGTQNSP